MGEIFLPPDRRVDVALRVLKTMRAPEGTETQDLIVIANGVQEKVMSQLNGERPRRKIKKGPVDRLEGAVAEQKGMSILMKHGGRQDSLTDVSIAEAASTSIVIDGLMKRHQRGSSKVRTSAHTSAAQAAKILDYFNREELGDIFGLTTIGTKPVENDKGLDGANYPPNRPEGSLIWDPHTIDRACGEGTFDKITAEIAGIIDRDTKTTDVNINVTHTQQIDAAHVLAKLSLKRLGELGFLLFSKRGTETVTESFPDGLY